MANGQRKSISASSWGRNKKLDEIEEHFGEAEESAKTIEAGTLQKHKNKVAQYGAYSEMTMENPWNTASGTNPKRLEAAIGEYEAFGEKLREMKSCILAIDQAAMEPYEYPDSVYDTSDIDPADYETEEAYNEAVQSQIASQKSGYDNEKKEEFEADKIRSLMIGRKISEHYYREDIDKNISNEVVLEMNNVSTEHLSGVTIQLHKGEILGIGGLSDCGMHEVGRVMFGLDHPETGHVLKNGKEEVKSPKWAVDHSIGYVSKNRDQESMMLICSINDNIGLPSLKELSVKGAVSNKKQRELSEKWSKKMEVKADSIKVFCNTLSGGNKQKVVLAKWLGKGSDILILDCPTRGIDVGTKAAIYQLIEDLKKEGRSILLISEELQELIGMSDRIILLKDGAVTGEFRREDGLSEEKLIQKMI